MYETASYPFIHYTSPALRRINSPPNYYLGLQTAVYPLPVGIICAIWTFDCVDEVEVLEENPSRHRDNMQSLHRKTPPPGNAKEA